MIAATNFSDEAGVAWLRLDRDTFYLCNCRRAEVRLRRIKLFVVGCHDDLWLSEKPLGRSNIL